MNRSQLLKRLDEAWQTLIEAYSGLPGPTMAESCVTGSWSIKDIIAHVTSWEEESLRHLPLILAGEKTPRYSARYGGIDAFNALKTERNRELSLSEVLRQRDDIHCQLIQFIHTVPENQFVRETRFRRRLRLDTYDHYAKHAKAIRTWRERRP